MNQILNYPIKKAHQVGTSVVLTIDQSHVKRLKIDDQTFFVEKPVDNGILLEMHRLRLENNSEPDVKEHEIQ
jgi:hypothetical protein